MTQPNALSFELFWEKDDMENNWCDDQCVEPAARSSWNHQQAIIDQLQRENAELRAIIKNAALERGLT